MWGTYFYRFHEVGKPEILNPKNKSSKFHNETTIGLNSELVLLGKSNSIHSSCLGWKSSGCHK